MVTLTYRGDLLVEDVAWFRVDDPSVPGAARRAAASLASRVGFSASRAAEIGVAATEMATNLLRYADEGAFLLRVVRWSGADPRGGRPCDSCASGSATPAHVPRRGAAARHA